MPSIIDLLKKSRIGAYLGKYHLSPEQFDKVYDLYTIINKVLNEHFSDQEKEEYVTVSRNRILERILDDLADSVKNNKDFMINDFTLEYLLNNKNANTLLQFASSFHFMMNQNSINRMNCYYSLEHFIEYIYKRTTVDKEYLDRLCTDKYFSKLIDDYQESINTILELQEVKLLSIFNQLVGLIWYNEQLNQENIIKKVADYIYNNQEELLSKFSEMNLMGDDIICDEYDNLLEDIIYNKVKRIDGEYDG